MEGQETLWADLGMNLRRHDALLQALGKIYGDVYLKQENRPEAMKYFDFVVSEVHGLRIKELLDHKSAGGRVAGTFCVYAPEEIITAANGIDVGLCGGAQFTVSDGEAVLPANLCALIKSAVGFKLAKLCPYFEAADFLIGETTCDGKKKTWELLSNYKPVYVMSLPHKKDTMGRSMWRQEVRALAAKMESETGAKIGADKLRSKIRLANQKRLALQRLYETRKSNPPPISGKDALLVSQIAFYDNPERFTARTNELAAECEKRVRNGSAVGKPGLPRVMISGCPMAVPNWKLHHVLETSGASVVVEETCTGTRYFTQPIIPDSGRIKEELLDAIADRYLAINCACFTPNNERVEDVLRLAREYRVSGVVYYVLQFCHTYNVEYYHIQKALKDAGIPVLKIETDYTDDSAQIKNRVDAFIEQLTRLRL
jgi:benzoyl-CoA reductase/2-hydroxyglutaryl-CoA dehydratase subunit BcrC/BadD/HgdB